MKESLLDEREQTGFFLIELFHAICLEKSDTSRHPGGHKKISLSMLTGITDRLRIDDNK